MLKAFSLRNLISCNNLIKKSNFLSKINMDKQSLSTDAATLNNGNSLKKDNSNLDDVDVVANKKIKLDNNKEEEVVNNLNDINTTPDSVEKSAIKKRKYALLIGYCGEGYFGLQR
jgi:hypothetical protein